ncbi:MAG: DUF934 domain-containing protein [Dongiaceae bacterium]
MPLVKHGAFIENEWTAIGDEDALPGDGPITVSLARWQKERDALAGHNGRLGLRLPADADPASIRADLDRFELIVLDFPKFNVGRALSQARMIRQRFGFAGEIRATGHVIRDLLLFMARCGIDAFELAPERTIDDWRAAMREFSVWYQPAADARVPATELRHRAMAAE